MSTSTRRLQHPVPDLVPAPVSTSGGTAPRLVTEPGALRYGLHEVDGHRLLARDAPGGVRIVEALGDIEQADHVAVLVPGNGHHLGNYFSEPGPVAPRARGTLLLATMRALAPRARSAVVVWVGYRAPAGLRAAASIGPAQDGAADLARLTYHLPRSAHITVVGHSYGSTVGGLALKASRADDFVALGSPGIGVRHRAELGTGVHLWAAQARHDWIRYFPRTRIGRLGLGRSPLHPDLGATRFDTGHIAGHCGYYDEGSESLRNIARVAVGHHTSVTSAGTAVTDHARLDATTRRRSTSSPVLAA